MGMHHQARGMLHQPQAAQLEQEVSSAYTCACFDTAQYTAGLCQAGALTLTYTLNNVLGTTTMSDYTDITQIWAPTLQGSGWGL